MAGSEVKGGRKKRVKSEEVLPASERDIGRARAREEREARSCVQE